MQDKIEKMGFLERATLFKQAVEKAQVTKQAVSAARLLIDDNFVSVWNMLGGGAL